MLSIKMGGFTEGNEELGPICISASVGAWKKILLAVFNLEVFFRKFFTVNGLPARTVAFGEVASLRHVATVNTMEAAGLVAKILDT